MKLLAINGSQRKGNSSNALKLIRDSFPGIDFEILHLNDLEFKLCKGCNGCVFRGEAKCPLKDDREKSIGQILKMEDGEIDRVFRHIRMQPGKEVAFPITFICVQRNEKECFCWNSYHPVITSSST